MPLGPADRQWRSAVVGTGFIAGQHLACLRSLAGVEVVGVCDLSPAVAEATAERFELPNWFTDHQVMLERLRPDVVHVCTPAFTHLSLVRDAFRAGAHVLVEKPVAASYGEWAEMRAGATDAGLLLVEDYNYLFDRCVLDLDALIGSGGFGRVSHVDVRFFQAVGEPTHAFGDRNAPHPTHKLPAGAVSDFLPHLASLAHHFVGPHRSVSTAWRPGGGSPAQEFVALVDAEGGTATIGFNADSRPEGFWIEVYGARMQARINLYEGRLSVARTLGGPSALVPVRNAVAEARSAVSAAFVRLWDKVSGGPVGYDGLWELVTRFYSALSAGAPPPVSLAQMEAVNLLIADITRNGGPE
jgi:predicted dehydrogenase